MNKTGCRINHDDLQCLSLGEFLEMTDRLPYAVAHPDSIRGELYQEDGEGGQLLLRNCRACHSTVSYPMQEAK